MMAGMPDPRAAVDDPTSPHLLYVAWGYPPSRGAGMYRALATANLFAQRGWRVTVLTATRDTFERITGSDPEAEKSIDPRVRVVRIPFDPERGETDLRRWSRGRLFSPLLWNFLRWIRASAQFPENGYAVWRRPLERAAEEIHRGSAVDLVIGSANPNVDFVAGARLHRLFGVPFVIDHRDAWHLDVYTGRRLGRRWSRSRRIERRLFADATEAWFVNAPIRDWHAAEHPARADDMHVVSNGFDPGFLDLSGLRTRRSDEGLVFGYLGTIYGPIPLRETLEAWRAARATSPILARSRLVFRGRLGHFAEPDAAAAALLDEFRGDGVTYEGPVSKTDVARIYQQFDALLLIISRSRYVTSGKVFEYAATGLPIAAIHHPETAATSVLEGHPMWFPVADLSSDEIRRVLVQVSERAQRMTEADLAEARRWAQHLSREHQLLPRIDALRDRIGKGSR